MKIFLIILIFAAHSIIIAQGTFRPIDFQGAGWVTAVKYSSNTSRLYARTDVGGAYRSDDGGTNWHFIATYATTVGGLMIQGIAIKPDDPNTLLLCCGTSYLDTDPNRGIWKTSDAGTTWTHVLSNINFSGNDDIRWGGECIIFDPSNNNVIYAGGRASGIYKSTDVGNTWTQLASSNTISGDISTIAFRNGNTSELWVGSESASGLAGVWRSTNGGSSWTQMRTSAQIENEVFRIIVKSDGTAFVAYNDKLVKYSSGTWTNINDLSTGGGNLTAIHFMGSEYNILAGKMNYTVYSTDGGQTFPITLNMNIIPPPPLHSFYWTYISWGRNQFMQNPSNANEWFAAGGFGCYKSTDGGQNWRIASNGINIPVMYRTHFHSINSNLIYTAMGDLTFGRITDGGASGELTNYPLLYEYPIQQNITNATVVFTSSANSNKIYVGGGNDYDIIQPALFVSTNSGANFTLAPANGLPNATANRPILDGLVSNTDANKLIVFIGGNYDEPIGSDQGVFWSFDGGSNFTRANGIANNIFAPNIFSYSYMLGKDPFNTMKRYGYFLGDGGGFYESNDEGQSWTLKSSVISGYKNPGTLCINSSVQNLFYIAITGSGLFKTTDGGTSWNNISGWVSASQVDSKNNLIVAFGQRSGDQYDKIYSSSDNGSSWNEITNQNYRLPSTSSLVINPFNSNQLWIGTGGNGIYIFDGLTIGIKKISGNIPSVFKLYQNDPKPFNPTTKLNFEFPNSTFTSLITYDALGREVSRLVNQNLHAGIYEVEWNVSNQSSGIYFYKLTTSEISVAKKMVLIK